MAITTNSLNSNTVEWNITKAFCLYLIKNCPIRDPFPFKILYTCSLGLCMCMHAHVGIPRFCLKFLFQYTYEFIYVCVCAFSCQVMFDSWQSHGLQYTRLPYPSLSPGVCSNSCSLSWWCYPTIASSVTPFSFCLQSSPASGSFPMSRLFALVAKVLELQL